MIRRQEQYYQIQNGTGQFRVEVGHGGCAAQQPGELPAGRSDNDHAAVSRISIQYYRTWEPHIYVQDDWHATRKLTLNLGLRWDHIGQLHERDRSALQLSDRHQHILHQRRSLRAAQLETVPTAIRLRLQRG